MALFTPYKLGPFELAHRIVYAPLTRCRSPGYIPQPNAQVYYSQRASPGQFMLTEATTISQQGDGYVDVPGIYTQEQVDAWKPVVDAVHKKDAIFFCQLWHVGRASHNDFQPDNQLPVSSSATPWTKPETVYTKSGAKTAPTPRALDITELPGIVNDYRNAARNALKAGFDGVEIHSANGYLLEQFLKDGTNKRNDEYGGSIENRCRLTLEVVKAVVDEVGADRVGIRLSPHSTFLDSHDSDPVPLYVYLCEQLNKLNIAYVHMVEPRIKGNEVDPDHDPEKTNLEPFRKAWKGTFIAAGGYTRETGMKAVEDGHADLICYGRVFLANPDLVKRFKLQAPLNKYNRDLFYAPDQVKGYIDYPFLEETGWQEGTSNVEAI